MYEYKFYLIDENIRNFVESNLHLAKLTKNRNCFFNLMLYLSKGASFTPKYHPWDAFDANIEKERYDAAYSKFQDNLKYVCETLLNKKKSKNT